MIKAIQLNNIATYTSPVSIEPSNINFFYGSNGSGKTTLANVIGQQVDATVKGYKIDWENQTELPVVIYNKNFVAANFGETIGGIFTLGKNSKEAQEFITNHRKEAAELKSKKDKLSSSKTKRDNDLTSARADFDESCWATQQTYGEKFASALAGFRGNKRTFSTKCLEEFANLNGTNSPDICNIEELHKAAYGKDNERYDVFPKIDVKSLKSNEQCELLSKRITGSLETPVGKFIEFLQNSDWVRQGIDYASRADEKCPYCQQKLPENLQQSIADFFDESYTRDCAKVQEFEKTYSTFTSTMLTSINSVLNKNIPLIDVKLFQAEANTLSKTIEANRGIIAEKIKSPSTCVEIESVETMVDELNKAIDEFNEKIKQNNAIIDDQAENQKRCQKEIWQFFTYELRETINQHQQKTKDLNKSIKSLSAQITEHEESIRRIQHSITEKEKSLTSVVPTINAINKILKGFGFTGFELAENSEVKGTYKIIRPDGSDAQKTLSEGEHNFIVFLYFYHLVYGSLDGKNIDEDKIVVIDDPISSVDSNVLFIITTLVKAILADCRKNEKGIKQIFILTHNVYFHKEISFFGHKKNVSSTKTAYWMVRKRDDKSYIETCRETSITTSYELLWAELQDKEAIHKITIFNTLRRILECYFNIIGGLNSKECNDKFDGQDKIICDALTASNHKGSHSMSFLDDFDICNGSESIDIVEAN